ncbi:restriction endonuclease [Candidatus Kaiserbacteria bacterium RIFCSPHIGHO2_02_FULL_55_25]|uniref:Restriction endonuclease n=1 Tax=Candidatus Kaiserbacteria bacterium RIFCSPHIGHO2_02_FULL_55_25 TaxID=1798498 RepID=A0A1F6E7Y4_9BACT|nr:MAG: restriction endonuclease [Candidatus Kaiserbacteria bacterium RIFCSPHIGHO2_01_FULL_55_79]OGG69766.1 MAG: restriction endonuclease [Candidatus Kaiserbacteria bacterium RIFCSPHIGHO2_02_FULL_55_25]OGG77575.1 MAG: restriction endonuclease [Candidatus Kaiserbacteria bacterium RIFCSPHIGHO2_12_FULL_55_13]OGG83209.1 MAG: restriction endonuclease [Candidatus Kaiserbacteria bacterium RIFCSPLOWO2_01_FULL_55_25]
MAIPKYEELMLPVLEELADGGVRSGQDVANAVAHKLHLSQEDLEQMLPSGKQKLFQNREAWAVTYMAKAGLIERPERGFLRITERGSAVLKQKQGKIDNVFLFRFKEFQNFKAKTPVETTDDSTPQEDLEKGFQAIGVSVREEILERLHEITPSRFEQVVIDVLVAMGYGGSHEDAAKAVGKSGDEGIDGVINEDRLGLDSIYIQAKRWKNNVGRPDVQSFVGALSGRHASKGIFITTSSYTNEATEYAKTLREKVILIDGERLAALMFEFNIGVSTENTYHVKRIDTDYFLNA